VSLDTATTIMNELLSKSFLMAARGSAAPKSRGSKHSIK
jgi:hypothetical protein